MTFKISRIYHSKAPFNSSSIKNAIVNRNVNIFLISFGMKLKFLFGKGDKMCNILRILYKKFNCIIENICHFIDIHYKASRNDKWNY